MRIAEPIYDITKSYEENLEQGPKPPKRIPKRIWPPQRSWGRLFGMPIASRIGVPAGPLLDSSWCILAAQLGYDIITYKTIRTKKHPAHPLPNMVHVDPETPAQRGQTIQTKKPPKPRWYGDGIAVTNSFGIPSADEKTLKADILYTKKNLQKGQVLIVSVFGTGPTETAIIKDFIHAAKIAKVGGADIIELNCSCPNICGKKGQLFENPEMIKKVGSAVVSIAQNTPIILKVGHTKEHSKMESLYLAADKAGIRGICGINTIRMSVENAGTGTPALGEKRIMSGICGSPIYTEALSWTKHTKYILNRLGSKMTVLTTGGVSNPSHLTRFLENGADIAMTATGFMWYPHIAHLFHKSQQHKTTKAKH